MNVTERILEFLMLVEGMTQAQAMQILGLSKMPNAADLRSTYINLIKDLKIPLNNKCEYYTIS